MALPVGFTNVKPDLALDKIVAVGDFRRGVYHGVTCHRWQGTRDVWYLTMKRTSSLPPAPVAEVMMNVSGEVLSQLLACPAGDVAEIYMEKVTSTRLSDGYANLADIWDDYIVGFKLI